MALASMKLKDLTFGKLAQVCAICLLNQLRYRRGANAHRARPAGGETASAGRRDFSAVSGCFRPAAAVGGNAVGLPHHIRALTKGFARAAGRPLGGDVRQVQHLAGGPDRQLLRQIRTRR
eukprot:COSAG02_NODE_135_length_34565_cov_80.368856_2_plen_120_part_00